VERRELGGWLQGPGASRSGDRGRTGASGDFPGRRLGRPAEGPGSIAGFGRRLAALAIDWGFALLIGHGLMGPLRWGSAAPLVALLAMNLLLVGTAGFTLGHRILGLRVETVDGAPPGPIRALVRSVLLCLAAPPLIWDRDQRGLHDKVAGTLVARI
jgi:uncharacterized RDD family membrane protein YckC